MNAQSATKRLCPKCGSEMKKAMDKIFRLWWVCDCDEPILIDCGHEEKVGGEKG